MKLKNTSDLPDAFLRRLSGYCCKRFGIPASRVRSVNATKYSGSWRGRCWYHRGRILLRIGGELKADGSSRYPMECKYPGRVNAPTYTLADRTEAIVHLFAHEIAHIVRYMDGANQREATVDAMAIKVLQHFRENREKLLAAWWKTPAPKIRPVKSRAEKNEAAARAKLAEWERKLKLAKTKVSGYRAKVKRYDRKAAACQRGKPELS